MLRAEIRAAYGRGVKYHWSVTPNLRVYLVSIDWIPGQKAGLKPSPHFSDRLAAACDGRAAAPDYLHVQPLSLAPSIGGPDLSAQHQHLDPDQGPEEGKLRREPDGRVKE